MPYLSKILIHPSKSLDAVEVTTAQILPGGAIAHDREFAVVDEQGQFVHAKHTEKIHSLRSRFDLTARTVTFLGSHACARCIVPTRNPWLEERDRHFQKEFVAQRKATFPAWAKLSHFDHFYRLTLNTQVLPSEAGKTLRLNDLVSL